MNTGSRVVATALVLIAALSGCAETEPLTVEVTREVEVPQIVEVTRVIEQEIEVTREVEVTRELEVTREVEVETEPEETATTTPQAPGEQLVGPGTFLVGTDIAAGTYRIEGEDLGYVRRLSCLDGTSDCTIAMIDMEGGGYVTVLESDKALSVGAYGGGAVITKVEMEAEAEAEVDELEEQLTGPGIFLVGMDITPGTYRIEGEDLGYARRLSCLDGTTDCVTAMIDMEGGGYVTVEEGDVALSVGAYGGGAVITKVE